MTRAEIILANPLVTVMQDRGIIFRPKNGRLITNRCATTEHRNGHFPVSVDLEKQVWHCNDCSEGGSVIDFVMLADGLDAKAAMEKLAGEFPPPPKKNGAGKIVKTYDYTDEDGALLYQVCRYEPKDFRQRRPDGKGGWIWTLDDTRRVLYKLPTIAAADLVWLTEGEKDADTLSTFSFVATTNGMGAGKWLPEYSASLRGKDVVIVPDGDETGAKHRDLLLKELGPVTKSLRVVEMPEGWKDVSEYVASFATKCEAGLAILSLADKAQVLYRGEAVPVQTMEELENEYRDFIKRSETLRLSLCAWLPSLQCLRPLVPGEMVAILAATGCGKTMLLHNIAYHAGIETLLFELELPETLTFERLAAIAIDGSGGHVESMYRMGGQVAWRDNPRLCRISLVHRPRLKPADICRIIQASELKTSRRPALVLLDYVQLVSGSGESRYERTSSVMEEMKVIARETNTVIVIASQISRTEAREVSLASGKDSGSIENSAGIVLGAWRDNQDSDRLWIRVLKNTKGKSGTTIPCRIKSSLRIMQEESEK